LNAGLAGDIAAGARVKKLVLFHYTGLDSDEKMISAARQAGFKEEIVIGKDFQSFKL